ncbi:MAG: hypothetical protein J3R72DRAFT_40425 [Linnemannia gamsii]|nr:MAG: hypothetical protein J3R72DRAFT_40425 [Linnemannia gamsii]
MTFGHWTSGIQESTNMDMDMDAHSFRNRRGNRKTGKQENRKTGRQEQEQERQQENRNSITGTGSATMDAHPSATGFTGTGTGEATGLALHTTGPRCTRYSARPSCCVGPQEKKTLNRGMGAALQTPIDMPSVSFSASVPTSRPERGSWTEGACS